MNDKKLLELISEEVVKKLLSDEERIIEERTYYTDGSGYSSREVVKHAFSEITQAIFNESKKLIIERFEKFKIETSDEAKNAIASYMSKPDIIKIIDTIYIDLIDSSVKSNNLQKVKSNINDAIRDRYSTYFDSDCKNVVDRFVREYSIKKANEYLDENKESIMNDLDK